MKIGALIPVRLTSERLPGKQLMPIVGRPAIYHLLDRLCASRYLTADRVVVCCTEDSADDPLVPVVLAYGARVFRGSTDDIIDRFYQAWSEHGFDAVIEADGDDICADPQYMDLCMDRLLADPALGSAAGEGLPIGIQAKALRWSAMESVHKHYTSGQNDTGFIYYFWKAGLCRHEGINPLTASHTHPTARITLDYPQDLDFFEAVFRELYVPGKIFGIGDIVALLHRRPDLLQLNAGLDEQWWARTRRMVKLEYRDDTGTAKMITA